MSNNNADLSEMSNPNRQKELDDEIESFHKRANEWLKDINKDHESEKKQLKDKIDFLDRENAALKSQLNKQYWQHMKENEVHQKELAEFRKKFAEANKIKKTTPPQVTKNLNEAIKKQMAELEAKYKQAVAEKEASYDVIRVHMRTEERLKEKLFDQLKALNYFRKKAGEWELSEEKLKEEVEGYHDEELNKLNKEDEE